MELLWTQGESNVRAILDQLNERSSRERKYTTVMTTMARLHTKGLLVRRREGKTDFYRPAMARDEYLGARAEAEVGTLVEHYGDAALVHFVRQVNGLEPERLDLLRRLAERDGD